MVSLRQLWKDVGWLFVLILTFAVPFALDAAGRLTYFTSLLFWVLPILYLWPLFHSLTARGTGRRRRALRTSVVTLLLFGAALDFLIGPVALNFDSCETYVYCLRGPAGLVPIEELLFYASGPAAMVLVYACADERWLKLYNPPDSLGGVKLIKISLPWLSGTAAFAAALLMLWKVNGTFPAYLAFLGGLGLLPTIVLYRTIRQFMNWPAFAVTVLYVIATSVIWEVTLALPRGWWGFQPGATTGFFIKAWAAPLSQFPVEEVGVWLAAPFFTLLTYEFAKAFFHHPLPTRTALFGRSGGESPTR